MGVGAGHGHASCLATRRPCITLWPRVDVASRAAALLVPGWRAVTRGCSVVTAFLAECAAGCTRVWPTSPMCCHSCTLAASVNLVPGVGGVANLERVVALSQSAHGAKGASSITTAAGCSLPRDEHHLEWSHRAALGAFDAVRRFGRLSATDGETKKD